MLALFEENSNDREEDLTEAIEFFFGKPPTKSTSPRENEIKAGGEGKIANSFNELLLRYDNKIVNIRDRDFEQLKCPFIIIFHHFNEKFAKLVDWTDIYYEVARKYCEKITFAIADLKEYRVLNLDFDQRYFDAMKVNNPPWMYIYDKDNRQYDCCGFFTVDRISEFADKLINDELYKSEPLPALQFDNLVKICVANNFQGLVLDSDEDVFISFYTDWCHISKELVVILEKLAEILKDENILILKMNADLNYIPLKYGIWSYPTSLYLTKGDNKTNWVVYNQGPRTIENLIKFIAANSTDELKFHNREGLPK